MATVARLLTYEDLIATPDDGQRYEIIGGRLVVSGSASRRHQQLSLRLVDPLYELQGAGLGEIYAAPMDVRLSDHDWVVPDLSFVKADRLETIGRDLRFLDGPPDLVIEIASPSTQAPDLGEKEALYAAVGVPEYWRVDGRRSPVVALALTAQGYVPIPVEEGRIRSRVLPGFEVDIEALFAGLPDRPR